MIRRFGRWSVFFWSMKALRVIEASNGKEAVEKSGGSVDLIIPGCDDAGEVRDSGLSGDKEKLTVPILFLTARTQDSDKALGFCAGEMITWQNHFPIRSWLRESRQCCADITSIREAETGKKMTHRYKSRICFLNKDSREVRLEGGEILLTDLEYRILLLLAENRGRFLRYRISMRSVWEEPYYYISNNTVMVHIRNLRKNWRKIRKIRNTSSMYGERGTG